MIESSCAKYFSLKKGTSTPFDLEKLAIDSSSVLTIILSNEFDSKADSIVH